MNNSALTRPLGTTRQAGNSIRELLALTALTGLLLSLMLSAPAHGVTLKIATVAPEGTAWMKEMREAASRIKEQTSGRVLFKYYPGGVMGSSDTVLRKMRVGQLHGGAFTAGELAGRDPDLLLYGIPFMLNSADEADLLRKTLDPLVTAGLKDAGLAVVGISGGGFVNLFSDKPVRKASDLTNAKVWTPEGDVVSDLAFRMAGVSPVPLSLPDVYTALQTGALDTVVNTTAGAIAFQWHTKMKTMTDFPVAYVMGLMALDQRAFSRLSDEDQMIVQAEMAEAFSQIEATSAQDVVGAKQALKNQGIEIIALNETERADWLALGQRLMERLKTEQKFELEHLDIVISTLASSRVQE
ncbi:MAG: TRAP transporter substrate-binding protein DctP [Lysobacterales bacterium]